MSRKLSFTQADYGKMLEEFQTVLNNAMWGRGEVSYKRELPKSSDTTQVLFTFDAWSKMQLLIREFDSEVAWHGLCKRQDDDYLIYDILVYPQTVTGVTVETDQKEYEQWLMEQEDEVFSHIRMQGHSHVNMGTSPSGVDIANQKGTIVQLKDDMFYIFMIWNKKGENTTTIYDKKKNTLYEPEDIDITVLDDPYEEFRQGAIEKIQRPKPRVFWKKKASYVPEESLCEPATKEELAELYATVRGYSGYDTGDMYVDVEDGWYDYYDNFYSYSH